MPDHEPKCCPRCGNGFECRLGSIHRCQCVDIALSDEMRESIAHRYDDCLCRDCLMALSAEDTSGGPNRAGIQGLEADTPAAAGPAAQPTSAVSMHADNGTPVSARIRQRSQAAARARRVRPDDLIRLMQGLRR